MFFEKSDEAQSTGDSWLSKVWNHPLSPIPDAVYINLSATGAFVGGGGVDVGVAVPLKGSNAFNFYLYRTFKFKLGAHVSVGANLGIAKYLGDLNNFDFVSTFGGKSAGIEGDYSFLGAGVWNSSTDKYGGVLFGEDVGIGAGIGGSTTSADTWLKQIPSPIDPILWLFK